MGLAVFIGGKELYNRAMRLTLAAVFARGRGRLVPSNSCSQRVGTRRPHPFSHGKKRQAHSSIILKAWAPAERQSTRIVLTNCICKSTRTDGKDTNSTKEQE